MPHAALITGDSRVRIKRLIPVAIAIMLLVTPLALLAQEESSQAPVPPQTFTDVSPEHPSHTAVEFLAANGVLRGYEDGTFRPDNPVNRAEALKMIVAPRAAQEDLAAASQSGSIFTDVAQSDWYHPYVVVAVARAIIDGPLEKEAFHGADQVILAEFLKMLQLSFGIDPVSDFGDITFPLAQDVHDPGAWYYPYLRYALASSMVTALADGMLKPSHELTRADAAELLFSLIAYREGIRTPVLLKIAEAEVQNVLSHLSRDDTAAAGFASARSVIAARGAIAKSEDPKAKGIVKITEAFVAVVECVIAGKEGRFAEAEAVAKVAWEKAGKARAFSEELDLAAGLAQKIATNLAEQARAMMEKGN